MQKDFWKRTVISQTKKSLLEAKRALGIPGSGISVEHLDQQDKILTVSSLSSLFLDKKE